jgi:hypothetical protein
MDSLWQDARVDELFDKLGKFSTFRELIGEGTNLFWGRNLSGEQEPEHALRNDLPAINSSGELFLAIWDGQSVEADTLVICVRCRAGNSMAYARTSFGSRTEPSQRRALRPRIPPMRFSTWDKLSTCAHVSPKGRSAYLDFADNRVSMFGFLRIAL